MVTNEDIVPTTISNLIERQFPPFFKEHGAVFIAFARAYYEWMESPTNPLYYARRYYQIKDIDTTLDEFIVFFKEKYLKNIQLTTESDTRLLIKHALDIYRSKGTERCVELLFQLVYNRPVRFYYPSQDLFKLSDGQWFRPTYLELTLSENNVLLNGKEVTGLRSNALGFVENVVRRRTNGRLQDVAYISALNGDFRTYEKIRPTDNSMDIDICPTVIGSLTEITMSSLGSGQNFAIGDVVQVTSQNGSGALARVANITNQFGLVTFALDDGGYGYNSDSDIYISNTQLRIGNVALVNASSRSYTDWLQQFNQPLAYVNYVNANGIIQVTDPVTTYYGNGNVMGTGIVLTKNQINTTAGTLLVSVLTGSLNNVVYTTANAISANLALANGYFSVNATGSFIGDTKEVYLTVGNTSALDFIIDEFVYQGPNSGVIKEKIGANLVIGEISGIFRPNIDISGNTSGATAIPTAIGLSVGLVNVHSDFVAFPGNRVTSPTMTGTVEREDSAGGGLSLNLSNSFLLTETVLVSNTFIAPYLTKALNANTYGFPANTSANLTNISINGAQQFDSVEVGKISNVTVSGFGTNYSIPPIVTIDAPLISSDDDHHDIILDLLSDSAFIIGELVTQSATNARGTVRAHSNTSVLYLQQNRYNANNNFILTTNATTTIVGVTSEQVANVRIVSANTGSMLMGRNAVVDPSFVTGNGAVTTLTVIDSGFGFVEDEPVTIAIGDTTATGNAHLTKQGSGSGYYRKKGGFLSDQKKLFDGDYYQNYSYEIISEIMLNKYQDMLKQITHPTGTKMFGRLIYDTKDNNSVNISKVSLTIS